MLSSLLPDTKAGLLRSLLRGPQVASELAERSGLHVTVVRRHMKDLIAAHLAETASQAGPRGRPSNVYSITQRGRESFHARYDVVLDQLTRSMRTALGDPAAAELFARAAKEFAAGAGGARSPKEVVALSQALGFEPELKRQGGDRLLLSYNCPILTVAREHPDLTCDTFHCTLLGELLGTSPRPLRQAISRGAPYCVHELSHPAGPCGQGAKG